MYEHGSHLFLFKFQEDGANNVCHSWSWNVTRYGTGLELHSPNWLNPLLFLPEEIIFPFSKLISVDFLLYRTVWKWQCILTFSFKIFNKTAVLICHSFREDLWGSEEYPWLFNLRALILQKYVAVGKLSV
jgi:hypothetical protein